MGACTSNQQSVLAICVLPGLAGQFSQRKEEEIGERARNFDCLRIGQQIEFAHWNCSSKVMGAQSSGPDPSRRACAQARASCALQAAGERASDCRTGGPKHCLVGLHLKSSSNCLKASGASKVRFSLAH